MEKDIIVSASVLNADFMKLGAEIGRLMSAGADWVHIDVMDGRFVDSISFGSAVQKCLPDTLFKDTHLMVENPMSQIDLFVAAGSDQITFHLESGDDTNDVLRKILSHGIKSGIAIKPETPAEALFPYLSQLDLALVMTVEPGRGGQSFMTDMLKKISTLRERAEKIGKKLHIQVDGGINRETARLAVSAGADVLVSGTCLLRSPDPQREIEYFKQIESNGN